MDSEDSAKNGTSPPILFLPADFSLSAEKLQTVSAGFVLTLAARNTRGVVCPNYNAKVNLYPLAVSPLEISQAVLSPAMVEGTEFKSGFAQPNLTYNLYGTIKIRAEEAADSTKRGMSNDITFLPKSLSVSVVPPPGEREFFYIGEPINIIVKVEDALGNPIPNYSGRVSLISGYGLNPAPEWTFTPQDAGQRTFTANSIQAGAYTVTVKAEEETLKTESQVITVKSAIIQVIDTVSPVGTGEVIIQLVDESGRIITSESSLIVKVIVQEEVEDGSVTLPSGGITLTAGKAVIIVSNTEAEVVTIIPSSGFKIKALKSTITFGRAAKSGVIQLMWRELKGRKIRLVKQKWLLNV